MPKKISFFISSIFLLIAMPALASFNYQPMEKIPGFTTSGNFCNYIATVYNFGLWVIGICAMFMIIIGGYMYIMSAGNTASTGKAKGIITDAVMGLLLAFTAYLILHEINPDLVVIKGVCDKHIETSDDLTPAKPTPSETNSEKEKANREALAKNNISINHPNACTTGQTSGCTDVGGLQQSTMDGVSSFKNNCGTSCNVMITGGSEGNGIHSEGGTYSHVNGYKVDIQPTSEIDNYITKSGSFTLIPGKRSGDGAIGYKDYSGNTYYREANHWDVCYNCK